MKYSLPYIGFMVATLLPMTLYAETTPQAEDSLLATLKAAQPAYVMRDEDYRLDPKILKNSHVVGWVKAPLVDISRGDYVGYKRPVDVEMVVIAATGRIAETRLMQSSGSKKVDAKVQDALSSAILEKIPYADAHVSYVLRQKFDIEKPL